MPLAYWSRRQKVAMPYQHLQMLFPSRQIQPKACLNEIQVRMLPKLACKHWKLFASFLYYVRQAPTPRRIWINLRKIIEQKKLFYSKSCLAQHWLQFTCDIKTRLFYQEIDVVNRLFHVFLIHSWPKPPCREAKFHKMENGHALHFWNSYFYIHLLQIMHI